MKFTIDEWEPPRYKGPHDNIGPKPTWIYVYNKVKFSLKNVSTLSGKGCNNAFFIFEMISIAFEFN